MSKQITALSAGLIAALSLVLGAQVALAQTSQAPTGRALTAADAVRMAMAHSPSLAAAVDETRRATLLVESEDSRYTPLFTASAGWTHRATPSLRDGGVEVAGSDDIALAAGVAHTFPWGTSISADLTLNGAGRDFIQPDNDSVLRLGPTYGIGLRLQANQPLLRGSGTDLGEAGLRSARQSRTAAELARQEAASETVQTVLNAYWELWYVQRAAEIQRRGLEVAERQVTDADARYKAGALAAYDLLPLRTELASIREALSSAEGTVRQRQIALARPIGQPMVGTAGAIVAADQTPTAPAPRWDEATIIEAATANSYAIAQQQTAVARAQIEATAASEEALAKLDLTAWLAVDGLGDQDAGAAVEMFGAAEAVSGYVGVSLELPFDNTQRANDAARARLAVRIARSQLQDTTEQTVATAVQSLEAVHTVEARLKYAQETAAIAAESAEGQKLRFDAGTATATELVIAEQAHRQAELRVARAKADLALAHIALQHVVGVLIDEVAALTTAG